MQPELTNLLNNESSKLSPDKCDSTQSISSFLRLIPERCSTPNDGKGQSLTLLKKTPEDDLILRDNEFSMNEISLLVSKEDFGIVGDEETLNDIYEKINDVNEITFLIKEPRGYPCQNLNIVFPSEMPGIDWGYIICEQECVYPLFSGHNTTITIHFSI